MDTSPYHVARTSPSPGQRCNSRPARAARCFANRTCAFPNGRPCANVSKRSASTVPKPVGQARACASEQSCTSKFTRKSTQSFSSRTRPRRRVLGMNARIRVGYHTPIEARRRQGGLPLNCVRTPRERFQESSPHREVNGGPHNPRTAPPRSPFRMTSASLLQKQHKAPLPVLKLRRAVLYESIATQVPEVATMGKREILPNQFGNNPSGCNPRCR
jgi:hypothetical protein